MFTKAQLEDFKWFVGEMPELFRQYGHCFLAIKNRQVLGTYQSYGEAVDSTASSEDFGTFIVQECGKSVSVYTSQIASAWVMA